MPHPNRKWRRLDPTRHLAYAYCYVYEHITGGVFDDPHMAIYLAWGKGHMTQPWFPQFEHCPFWTDLEIWNGHSFRIQVHMERSHKTEQQAIAMFTYLLQGLNSMSDRQIKELCMLVNGKHT